MKTDSLIVTNHAVERYRERIEDLDVSDDAIRQVIRGLIDVYLGVDGDYPIGKRTHVTIRNNTVVTVSVKDEWLEPEEFRGYKASKEISYDNV